MANEFIDDEQEVFKIAKVITRILKTAEQRLGPREKVRGDEKVRQYVDHLNDQFLKEIPAQLKLKGAAADLIIQCMNAEEVWDGTLGGAVEAPVAAFAGLISLVMGNVFGAAKAAHKIYKTVSAHNEGAADVQERATPEALEATVIQRVYNITFLDRNSLVLQFSPARFHITSMTPAEVLLHGTITKPKHIV